MSCELHVLMIGKGGVGKSSLANAILGSQECPVAEQPGSDITYYGPFTRNNVEVLHVHDTRGLLDGEDEIQDIAEKIQRHHSDFDIIIACIKFNDRFDLSNRMIFKVISQLGSKPSDIWPKVHVALTHSDITPADWPRHEINVRFDEIVGDWENAISLFLKETYNVNKPLPVYPTSHAGVKTSSGPLNKWLKNFLNGTGLQSISKRKPQPSPVQRSGNETKNTPLNKQTVEVILLACGTALGVLSVMVAFLIGFYTTWYIGLAIGAAGVVLLALYTAGAFCMIKKGGQYGTPTLCC